VNTSEVSSALSQNKKTLLILAGVGIVLIGTFLILVNISSSQQKSPSQSPSVSNPNNSYQNNSGNSNQQVLKPSNSPFADNLQTYKNSLYSVKYPKDWKAQEINVANGGSEVRIAPISSEDHSGANMIITSDSVTSVPSVKQKQQAFVGFGFKSDFINVASLQATRLKGIFPPADGNASESAKSQGPALQLTHVFFDNGNYSYLFDYSYVSKGLDSQLEDTFSKMIASFKFLQ